MHSYLEAYNRNVQYIIPCPAEPRSFFLVWVWGGGGEGEMKYITCTNIVLIFFSYSGPLGILSVD